jgi:hypothetical protein
VRSPADRPLSALLAIVVLVFSWALILFVIQSITVDRDAGLSALAEPAVADAQP